jgi:hypothetical protein
VPSLLEQARDKNYWRQLNPHLTISDRDDKPSEPIQLDPKVIDTVTQSLKNHGYFLLEDVIDTELVDKLGLGVENVWKSGWPTPFSTVYDEYWQLFRSLEALWTAILGPGYQQVPNFWCWFVDKTKESKGWGPHRDRPAVNTVRADGSLNTLTIWIPFADATALNGCMYVLPADRDPNFPRDADKVYDLDNIKPDSMQDIRALPARKGALLGWSEALVHWGSRSSDEAEKPRISLSFTYQRGDRAPYETPLFDPLQLPTFEFRLGFIAQNVERYQANASTTDEILAVCSRLSNNIPPLQITEGFERQFIGIDQRLSKSPIWSLQDEYREQAGIKGAPSLPLKPASSHLFAEVFAEQALAYLLDVVKTLNMNEPLNIIELDGHSGEMAFTVLSKLFSDAQQFESLRDLRFRYIITARTRKMFNIANNNSALDEFRKSKMIEFATFSDDSDSAALTLVESGEPLDPKQVKNPIIVISNNSFKSMRHDAFRTNNGELEETRFTFYRDGRNISLHTPVNFEQVQFTQRHAETNIDYYDDPTLNLILKHYSIALDKGTMLMPIGALRSIASLAKLSSNRMLLLALDKGFIDIGRMHGMMNYKFVSPAIVSYEVNFDAVTRYLESINGQCLVEPGDGFGYCAFTAVLEGGKSSALENLRHYFRRGVQGKDPINAQSQLQQVIEQALNVGGTPESASPVGVFTSVLKLSHCNPDVFLAAYNKFVNNKFRREFDHLNREEKGDFVRMLRKVQQNVRLSERRERALEHVFILQLDLGLIDECLKSLQESVEEYGEERAILDHFGLCYEKKQEWALSYQYFEKSFALDPTHTWARESMNRVKYRERPEKSGATFVVSKSNM